MSGSTKNQMDVKIWIGCLIVIAGVFQILNNFLWNIDFYIWEWWPLILIVSGLYGMTSPKRSRNWAGNVVMLALGLYFLFKNLDIVTFSLFRLWPLLLIFMGIVLIKQGVRKGTVQRNDDSFVSLSWILGGGDCRVTGRRLTGGHVSTFMGGGKIDFRDAEMESNEMVLDVSITLGGFELLIPDHWKPVVQCSPFLGGVEESTGKRAEGLTKTLILKGSIFMGGIEIK